MSYAGHKELLKSKLTFFTPKSVKPSVRSGQTDA